MGNSQSGLQAGRMGAFIPSAPRGSPLSKAAGFLTHTSMKAYPKMNNCIKFRFLKNRAIDLGDDREYRIPFEMRSEPTQLGAGGLRHSNGAFSNSSDVTKPVFDMSHEFEVPLLEERPMVAVRPMGMSQRQYDSLVDEALKISMQNKILNDVIRKRVKIFVESGTLEVISDSSPVVMEEYHDDEHTSGAANG